MKKAFVSGGSGGIGEAIVKKLCDEGYTVIFSYLNNGERAARIEREIKESGGDAKAVKLDVSKGEEVKKVTQEVLKLYKKIDLLVCNAAVSLTALAHKTTPEEYSNVMDINCKGVFSLCKAFLPRMIEQKSGCIINISSYAGVDGISYESVYSMSKGGVISYSLALAKEAGLSGVRVNALCPGAIDTDMNANLSNGEKCALCDKIILKRMGKPKEVANTVAFLAQASYITGSVLKVDGGLVI